MVCLEVASPQNDITLWKIWYRKYTWNDLEKNESKSLCYILIVCFFTGVGLGNGKDMKMEMWCHNKCAFKIRFYKGENCTLIHNVTDDYIEVKVRNCPALSEDVKVRFISKSVSTDSC